MKNRVDKYLEFDINEFQRSKKNANLYKEIYGNYNDFTDVPIPENTNEIDIDNLKSLVNQKDYKKSNTYDDYVKNEDLKSNEEEKVYDINTLLEKAKEENAKIKKENTVNKTISNYLVNLESDKNTKEIILNYDGDSDDDLPIVKEVKYVTSEIDLENKSIHTSTLSLDILSDLKPTENTMVSDPVNKDTVSINDERDFFDDRSSFSNEDFESEEEDEEILYEEKDHLFLKILLIIIGLATIFTAAYFILKEYTNIF